MSAAPKNFWVMKEVFSAMNGALNILLSHITMYPYITIYNQLSACV